MANAGLTRVRLVRLARAVCVSGSLLVRLTACHRQFDRHHRAGTGVAGRDLPAHLADDASFARLEDLALAALEDDMTLEGLKEGLGAIDTPAEASVQRAEDDTGLALRLTSAGASALGLAARLATPEPDGHGIWSAHMEGDCRVFTCAGLPGGDRFHALFDLDAPLWQEAAP